MKESLNRLLGALDIKILRRSTYDSLVKENNLNHERAKTARTALKKERRNGRAIEMLESVAPEARSRLVDCLRMSRSQLGQDLFVLSELGFKENGFFVEIGAGNGIDLSNTYLMETGFNWTGILAEPARTWHAALNKNRSATIEKRCVWRNSGENLTFNEATDPEFSTLDDFSGSDQHAHRRDDGQRYEVETTSLVDLLRHNDAPRFIDYLSIDTEGSEYEILRDFDFNRYRFHVVTCEHNHTPARKSIHELLTRVGYVRKFADLSDFDDWYVLQIPP